MIKNNNVEKMKKQNNEKIRIRFVDNNFEEYNTYFNKNLVKEVLKFIPQKDIKGLKSIIIYHHLPSLPSHSFLGIVVAQYFRKKQKIHIGLQQLYSSYCTRNSKLTNKKIVDAMSSLIFALYHEIGHHVQYQQSLIRHYNKNTYPSFSYYNENDIERMADKYANDILKRISKKEISELSKRFHMSDTIKSLNQIPC